MNYRSNIWKLYGIRMLFWMFFFSAILVPFFTEWGGLTLSEVFFLNAWFFFWNFVLEVPTGTVADFFGRKVSLAIGSLIGLVASVVYVIRPDIRLFLLAEILFAVAYTLHSGADEALAYDSLLAHEESASSKRVLSRMEAFKLAGIISGTLLGGFIAARWGLRAPMFAYVAPATLAFLLALSLREPPQVQPHQARTSYRTVLMEGGRYFLKHKILLLLAMDLALTNALAWGIIWLFQPLLKRAGLSLQYFGTVQALACVTQILLLSNVERMESWLGSKRRLLLLGSLATGAAFLLLSAAASPPLVVLGIVIAFTFGLTRVPLFSSYMNKYIPSERRATVLSMTSMLRTLSIVVMNPITGFFAERWLSWTLVGLGLALVVLPVFSRIEEHHLLE